MVKKLLILRVQHAQITIPKGAETQAREFYCDFLGLEEVPKPESLQGRGGFWLQIGAFQIHVGTEDGFDRTKTKAHIAYEVEDLNAWREKLEKREIEICGFAVYNCLPARSDFCLILFVIEPEIIAIISFSLKIAARVIRQSPQTVARISQPA